MALTITLTLKNPSAPSLSYQDKMQALQQFKDRAISVLKLSASLKQVKLAPPLVAEHHSLNKSEMNFPSLAFSTNEGVLWAQQELEALFSQSVLKQFYSIEITNYDEALYLPETLQYGYALSYLPEDPCQKVMQAAQQLIAKTESMQRAPGAAASASSSESDAQICEKLLAIISHTNVRAVIFTEQKNYLVQLRQELSGLIDKTSNGLLSFLVDQIDPTAANAQERLVYIFGRKGLSYLSTLGHPEVTAKIQVAQLRWEQRLKHLAKAETLCHQASSLYNITKAVKIAAHGSSAVSAAAVSPSQPIKFIVTKGDKIVTPNINGNREQKFTYFLTQLLNFTPNQDYFFFIKMADQIKVWALTYDMPLYNEMAAAMNRRDIPNFRQISTAEMLQQLIAACGSFLQVSIAFTNPTNASTFDHSSATASAVVRPNTPLASAASSASVSRAAASGFGRLEGFFTRPLAASPVDKKPKQLVNANTTIEEVAKAPTKAAASSKAQTTKPLYDNPFAKGFAQAITTEKSVTALNKSSAASSLVSVSKVAQASSAEAPIVAKTVSTHLTDRIMTQEELDKALQKRMEAAQENSPLPAAVASPKQVFVLHPITLEEQKTLLLELRQAMSTLDKQAEQINSEQDFLQTEPLMARCLEIYKALFADIVEPEDIKLDFARIITTLARAKKRFNPQDDSLAQQKKNLSLLREIIKAINITLDASHDASTLMMITRQEKRCTEILCSLAGGDPVPEEVITSYQAMQVRFKNAIKGSNIAAPLSSQDDQLEKCKALFLSAQTIKKQIDQITVISKEKYLQLVVEITKTTKEIINFTNSASQSTLDYMVQKADSLHILEEAQAKLNQLKAASAAPASSATSSAGFEFDQTYLDRLLARPAAAASAATQPKAIKQTRSEQAASIVLKNSEAMLAAEKYFTTAIADFDVLISEADVNESKNLLKECEQAFKKLQTNVSNYLAQLVNLPPAENLEIAASREKTKQHIIMQLNQHQQELQRCALEKEKKTKLVASANKKADKKKAKKPEQAASAAAAPAAKPAATIGAEKLQKYLNELDIVKRIIGLAQQQMRAIFDFAKLENSWQATVEKYHNFIGEVNSKNQLKNHEEFSPQYEDLQNYFLITQQTFDEIAAQENAKIREAKMQAKKEKQKAKKAVQQAAASSNAAIMQQLAEDDDEPGSYPSAPGGAAISASVAPAAKPAAQAKAGLINPVFIFGQFPAAAIAEQQEGIEDESQPGLGLVDEEGSPSVMPRQQHG